MKKFLGAGRMAAISGAAAIMAVILTASPLPECREAPRMAVPSSAAPPASLAVAVEPRDAPAPPTGKEPPCSEAEIAMLAKTVWGEARGCPPEEQALVVWTVLQRAGDSRWGGAIEAVVSAPRQFAYKATHPIDPQIYALCAEEAAKWAVGGEPPTLAPYAPAAPYFFFTGDGSHNWFRKEW